VTREHPVSRRTWLYLSFNPAAHSPIGNVKVKARLQIDPEFRRGAEVSPEAQRRVGRDRPTAKHDVVDPRARRAAILINTVDFDL
jgi:hypothetical protein